MENVTITVWVNYGHLPELLTRLKFLSDCNIDLVTVTDFKLNLSSIELSENKIDGYIQINIPCSLYLVFNAQKLIESK